MKHLTKHESQAALDAIKAQLARPQVAIIANESGVVSGSIYYENRGNGSVKTNPTSNNLTYNGSAQTLINGGTSDTGTMMYKIGDGEWSTSIPTAINAGTYTIYYKSAESSNYTESVIDNIMCSISKVTPTVIIPTAKVLTYNGSSQELINVGSTNFGTLQYKVDDGEWGTSIPTKTNGGSYTVFYRVVGDSNVNDVSQASINCSINEKQVNATVELSESEFEYTGSAITPTVTVKDGNITINPSEYTVTYSNNINVGTGTVTITDNTGGNYNVIGSQTFTINKVTGSVKTNPTSNNLTYNGSAQTLINGGTSDTGTMMYKVDDGEWSTSIPTAINAGIYTIYYKSAESANYTESITNNIICSIGKVTPTVTAPTAKSLTYDGTAQNLINAGSTNYGTIQYSTDNTTWSTTIPTGTNAITYTVYYKVIGNSNVNDVAAQSISTTINKANPTYTAPVANNLTYDGSAQALITSGSTSHGTIQYSTDNTTWSTTIPTGTDAGSYTVYWKLVGDSNHNDISSTSISGISIEMAVNDYSQKYLTIESLEDSNTISWKANNSSIIKMISVSTNNGETWADKTSSTSGVTLATLNTGDKLLVKGSNIVYGNSNGQNYNYFVSTKEFNVSGNIMSMIYGDNFIGQTTLDSSGSNLKYLFYNCIKLISAENLILPATILAQYCYFSMFYGCTLLTTVPELPATTLVDHCYSDMFGGCTSLTTAPELPATTLAYHCYDSMFTGCTALTTAPELPATTLANYCYQYMFNGCTALTTAPELPATTLVSGCYRQMFIGCTSLNYVKCLATNISADSCTTEWLSNVASTGTFVKADNMTSWTTGTSGIPSSWKFILTVTQDNQIKNGTLGSTDPNISWSSSSYTITSSYFSTPSLNNPHNVSITYSSSNTSVATINSSGKVTHGNNGSTIITATFNGNATYKPCIVHYNLTVNIYSGGSSGGGGSHE